MNPNPYIPFPMKVISVTPQTGIDWTFRVGCDFTPMGGQFMQLSLPGLGEAPISVSDFGEGWLDMTIRKVGRLTDGIFNLEPDDTLYARGPYGNGFDVSLYHKKDLLVVAGGTGLAPVKSLVKHFCNRRDDAIGFHLIAGFKSPSDILFADELEDWKSKADVILTVDEGGDGWTGNTGLVTKYIDSLAFQPDATRAVVVGPPVMIKFAILSLLERGMREENITVSFERRMSCGLGKCGHCKIDETYVCVDGPVFDYPKAKKLLD